MTTKELEDLLVEVLRLRFTDLDVDSYPDVIDENYELMHEKGAILVCWDGINEVSRDISIQGLVDEFEISVLSRSRRAPDGVLDIIEQIREVINSTFLCGLRLFFISANRVAYYYTEGVWHYRVKVIMPSIERI